MPVDFHLIVAAPQGQLNTDLVVAASRAGSLGILNLEGVRDLPAVHQAVARLERFAKSDYGIKLLVDQRDLLTGLTDSVYQRLQVVVLASHGEPDKEALQEWVTTIRGRGLRVLLEATDISLALLGQELGVDGIIAKGHETGGYIGEETTFILLQQCLAQLAVPVFAHGGIGLHTAAACYAAGATGVVLDWQLALARESRLPEAVRTAIAAMDGSETLSAGSELGAAVRLYGRPHALAANRLKDVAADLAASGRADRQQAWLREVDQCLGWGSLEHEVWPLGQDAAFARPLAERFLTVGGILGAFQASVAEHVAAASALRPLNVDSPLAQSHGTRYPIVQGPMTRVSDTARFALEVAEGGGLPFLALALMHKNQAMPLLEETRDLLGDHPWGVGILGFVTPSVRAEQLEAIAAVHPKFAIIAGGRPDQARSLEQQGIATYLHVPSPGLLRLFLADGARRFIFEGRECGGHVGPRSSFVLWDMMMDELLKFLDVYSGDPSAFHVLFAGGIHDALSASMVASLAAPLAERGVRLGVLMGTAYLFTEEAVSAGAITARYQQEAVTSRATVLVETGLGHVTRCLPTPFVDIFSRRKYELTQQGLDSDTLREELEQLNVGRLRVASKGVERNPLFGKDPTAPKFVQLDEQTQYDQGMYMIGQVADLRHQIGTVEGLHQDVAIAGSARLASLSAGHPTPADVTPQPTRIAIVGASTVLPGASNLQRYWENILDKLDAITEIPAERFDWQRYYDPDKSARDKIYARWGGFIDDIPLNPLDYGMPPNSIASIEPMQLLMLEVVRAALEDAGYSERPFPRERTSVTMAVGGGLGDLGFNYGVRSYLPHLLSTDSQEVIDRLDEILPEWTEDSFPGILLNVLAGRIANRFNFNGPNLVVDAACGSSLAALDIAIKDLITHRTDMAIVGGADTVQSPFGFLAFSKTQALSPRGRCRPFDVEADGIAISEGLAVIVLKRLEDAERDGDRIYAVIQGVGASSDGRDRSLTAPRALGQLFALRRAYGQAGFDPSTLGLIEAHGTGTRLGDQVEAEALSTLFSNSGLDRPACGVGSVKSMIGHTKSTAGLAGLIKVALGLYHKVLPPTLVDNPNPAIGSDGSPIYINSQARPWIAGNGQAPRRAGVSAFGFGGTNFHAALEEYRDAYLPPAASRQQWPAETIVLRAGDQAGLLAEIDKLAVWLADGNQPPLRDLAYTCYRQAKAWQDGDLARSPMTLALVADSLLDLRQMLDMARKELQAGKPVIMNPQGIYFAEKPLSTTGKVAFLFPGQGSQYPNMLDELVMQFPQLLEQYEAANSALDGHFAMPLSDYIFPVPAHDEATTARQREQLTDTRIAQPALGVSDLAANQFLELTGLAPDFVAGHSYGEIVALYRAGIIDRPALHAISAARGRFMAEVTGPDSGTMAAVVADQRTVESVARELPGVTIANLNSPTQTVISGATDAIEEAVRLFNERGVRAKRIPVACAFHSSFVEPAQQQLAAFLETVDFRPPRLAVYSNTLGDLYPEDPAAIREVLAGQLARPVRFREQIEAMFAAGARIFVEVGPRSVLTGLVHQILGNRPHLAVALDGGGSSLATVQKALAQLIAIGTDLDLEVLFDGRQVRQIDLSKSYQDPAQASYGPTTWLVNGGRARRWLDVANGLPAPVVKPLDVSLTSSTRAGAAVDQPAKLAVPPPPAPQPGGPATAPARPAGRTQPAPAPRQPAPSLHVEQPDAAAAVMLQTQQLMSRMLETQLNVMRAYLGDVPEAEPLPAPVREVAVQRPAAVQQQVATPPRPVASGRQPGSFRPAPVARFKLAAVAGPRIEATAGLAPGRAVVVTADAYGVADKVAAMLREQGYDAVIVSDSTSQTAGGASGGHGKGALSNGRTNGSAQLRYAARLSDPGEVHDLLANIRRNHGGISALLHLAPLQPRRRFDSLDLPQWRAMVDDDLAACLALIQGSADDLQSAAGAGGACLLAAIHLDGQFGAGGPLPEDFAPSQAGIGGLVKTAAHEIPSVRTKVVDLDPAQDAASLARFVLMEVGAADGETEAGYRNGGRTVLRVQPAPLPVGTSQVVIDEHSVILVTGGARGITASVAGELARRYRPTLILAGRSDPPPETESPETAGLTSARDIKAVLLKRQSAAAGDQSVAGGMPSLAEVEAAYQRLLRDREMRAALADLRRAGATVEYHSVDVRNELAFAGLIDDIYDRFGRLDGVIHGAGVVEDRLIRDKQVKSLRRVVGTKVDSAFVLSRRLRPESLRFLVFFSSVSGRFGNRGQGDYAAANEILNKLAVQLDQQWPGRVVSINWGPWDAGMVSDELRRQFEQRGVSLVPVDEGCQRLVEELNAGRKGDVEVLICGEDNIVMAATQVR